MKRLILFGELLCVNEILSERLRYMKLLETVDLLLKNKMSIEEIWNFYQRRKVLYQQFGIGILLIFILMVYHVYLHKASDLVFMIPGLSVCYLCVLPLVKPERNYCNVWDNKEEFVSLIRFNNIDQYMRHKESFWNNNISNNNERVLTLTNIYKFNVTVFEKKISPRERQLQKLLKTSRLNVELYRDIYPDEIINNIDKFQLTLTEKGSGETFDISLKLMIDSIINNVKESLTEKIVFENSEIRYLNKNLSYDARIKHLVEFQNNFNLVPLDKVVLFFQPLRKSSSCNDKLKCFGLTDDEFIMFIVRNFIENTHDQTKFLNLEYKRGTKGKLLTLVTLPKIRTV
ncbi:hypothetical protein [Sphingobacterium mizutaii]|uniref:hypothetical protein n=1 Tax=Sphingobacterium mizutaii TaxID=1010 RepID=UPI0028AF0148|nr:hypothetical protein [Sphingobacterium mizutaii]